MNLIILFSTKIEITVFFFAIMGANVLLLFIIYTFLVHRIFFFYTHFVNREQQ